MLNRGGSSGHRCLLLDLKGKAFKLPPVGLSHMALIMLRYIPLPTLLRVFIINDVESHSLLESLIYLPLN